MRVGMMGCRLLLLGSVAAASLLSDKAQAARSPDRGGAHAAQAHAAPAQMKTASASASSADRGNNAHRGGGSKASRNGGLKSGAVLSDTTFTQSGRHGVQHASFTMGRFGGSSRFVGRDTARVFSGSYRGGGYGVIQCVAFARSDTGIELSGNAVNWWGNATGRYARGSRPELGSILNFRATGHMPLGHVSVVSSVSGSREIVVDHAHWGGPGSNGGGVARGVTVIDVSPSNDWSEVRVSLGGRGEYGSTYPTFGFIYNRPDDGRRMTRTHMAARDEAQTEEVAEAPKVQQVTARRDNGDVYERNSQ